MRIIAGSYRGTRLASPGDNRIRPTSDRVREALFNILTHRLAVPFEGVRVLDLFAGTGALGIEALSRGATYCLFVEQSAEARAIIRQNVEALQLTGVTKIFRRDATDLGPLGRGEPFELVFLDPPYGKGLADAALRELAEHGWLAPGAMLVAEEVAGVALCLPDTVVQRDQRRYGDTQIAFLEWTGAC